MTTQYVTGALIKHLRENKNMTQVELAQKINVTDKAISKWETGRGLPDLSLVEPLAQALGVSLIELFSGVSVVTTNKSANMLCEKFYVCPLCGNVIQSSGDALISCCGITLSTLEAETPDDRHQIIVECIEDEYYVSVQHEMTKTHYISFIAAVGNDCVEVKKNVSRTKCSSKSKTLWSKIYLFLLQSAWFVQKGSVIV
jgi:DNA-binding XRE family transcriptional regulator